VALAMEDTAPPHARILPEVIDRSLDDLLDDIG
jgi:hypothetical protein